MNWYLAIFLIPLVVNPWGLLPYGSGKVVWLLIFSGLLIFAFGTKLLLRKKNVDVKSVERKLFLNRKVFWYLVLWILSLILSVVFSIAPVQSFFGEYTNFLGAFTFLLLFGHFLWCLYFFREGKSREVFFFLIKFVGVLAAVLAILQGSEAEYSNRLYGTFGQPNFMAQFLIFPLFLVAGDILKSIKKWTDLKKNFGVLLINFLCLIILVLAILLSGSRAVILAVLVGLWLWWIVFGGVHMIWKILSGVLGAGITIVFLWLIDLRSLMSRLFLWNGSFEILEWKYLPFGSGLETFYAKFAAVMPKKVFNYEKFFTLPQNPHNEMLQALVERGILGLVVYLIPIGFLLWMIFRRKLRREFAAVFFALISYYISVQFSFSVIEHLIYLTAFWALLLNYVFGKKLFAEKNFNSVARKFAGGLTVFVAIIILFFAVTIFRTDFHLKKGVGEYAMNVATADHSLAKAAEISVFWAYPKGIFLDFKSDERKAEEYGWITGKDFRYQIYVGDFDKAIELAPQVPSVYLAAGDWYFKVANCEKAVEMYRKLESLAPVGWKEKRLFVKHAYGLLSAVEREAQCSRELQN